MRRPIWNAGLLSVVIVGLLQLWRPYFFLTDDNLVGWLPVVVEVGRHLIHGQSPFVLTTIHGGNYDLLRDPAALSLWNPLTLGLSVLGQTALFPAIVDIWMLVILTTCASCTTALFCLWREQFHLTASDRRLVFLALSYTFCAYTLIIDSSWGTFAANQAALPMWLLGLYWPKRSQGIAWVAAAFAMSLLCGHLSPFLFCLLFVGVGALGLAILGRSFEPLLRLLSGGALTAALISPLLWQALLGFAGQQRSISVTEGAQYLGNVPPVTFLASFLGGITAALGTPFQIIGLGPGLSMGIVTCAAVHCLWHAIGPRLEQENTSSSLRKTQRLMLGCAFLVALFVIRPPWLQEVLSTLPLYKSLRFAFRESFAFLFFFHAWLALRPIRMARMGRHATIALGTASLAAVLFPWGPPSLLPSTPDRALVISGAAGKYWKSVKAKLLPGQRIVPVIDPRLLSNERNYSLMPQCLLGASNFPALYDVPSVSGYEIIGFGAPRSTRGVPGPQGYWAPRQARELQRKNPHLRLVQLEALQPLKIALVGPRSQQTLGLPTGY